MSTQPQSRWVRAGHSSQPAARAAGAQATRAALDGGDDPKLLVVFASFGYDPAEMVAGVAESAGPGVPVIGCSTPAEIAAAPAALPGAGPGVVVTAFGGGFEISTTHATGLSDDPRGVGEAVGKSLLPLPATRHRMALILTDTIAGDQQEMLRGVYGSLGATVPLVGGGAGDDIRMVTSHQFAGTQVLSDSVVAACIGTDGGIGVGVQHGWQRWGDAMVVTSSQGMDLHTIDDRPALDLYLEHYDAPADLTDDPVAFAAFALTRPLAISRRGDDAVRHVLGALPQTRSLHCAASVPRGTATWLTRGDVETTLAATDGACGDAIKALGDDPLRGLLIFDCVGRYLVLGDAGVAAERDLIARHAGGAPLAGLYTYGEIGRVRGVNGFHNQTIVAVAVG